jgi:hypothetical protein
MKKTECRQCKKEVFARLADPGSALYFLPQLPFGDGTFDNGTFDDGEFRYVTCVRYTISSNVICWNFELRAVREYSAGYKFKFFVRFAEKTQQLHVEWHDLSFPCRGQRYYSHKCLLGKIDPWECVLRSFIPFSSCKARH